MKLVFILVLTAFTVCLSRKIHRDRHEKKFPQGRLFPEYGTNFRYIEDVKHGLDRVTVVTSIPIPKYSDIRKILFNSIAQLT